MSALRERLTELRTDPLGLVVLGVGVTTVVAGLFQMVAPGVLLDILGSESTPTSRHFFAIVGMFMAVVGGSVVHAILAPGDHPIVILWGGLQKVGAVLGVATGVLSDLFSPLALLVVVFDAASAAVTFLYLRRVR